MKKTFEDIDSKPICLRLKELRLQLGFKNKSKFADMLGVKPQTYQNYESDRMPPIELIVNLANQFKHDVDFLWQLTGERAPRGSNASPQLNPVLLKEIIEGIESYLGEVKKTLPSVTKARLIALLYDHYAETHENVDRRKVVSYLKLVA